MWVHNATYLLDSAPLWSSEIQHISVKKFTCLGEKRMYTDSELPGEKDKSQNTFLYDLPEICFVQETIPASSLTIFRRSTHFFALSKIQNFRLITRKKVSFLKQATLKNLTPPSPFFYYVLRVAESAEWILAQMAQC